MGRREKLIDAARRGDAAGVLELLLQYRAIVNQPDGSGATAMHAACEEGHTDVVAVLLGIPARARPPTRSHTEGHTEVADVNRPDKRGCTPLYIASVQGHTEIVTMLIAAKANLNQATNKGRTPLYAACQRGHTEVVAKLLAANADVNQANNVGATPLHVACQEGRTEIVAKLIDAGASVHRFDNRGCTPMVMACARGHLGIVQFLSSYCAGRSHVINITAPAIAAHYGHHDIAAWLRATRLWSTALHHLEFLTPERARALLSAGDNIHAAAAPGGPTPLSLAQDLAAAGGAAEGTAAFLVLEAAKPWSRKMHKITPAGGARARRRSDADRAGHQARQVQVRCLVRRRLRGLHDPAHGQARLTSRSSA